MLRPKFYVSEFSTISSNSSDPLNWSWEVVMYIITSSNKMYTSIQLHTHPFKIECCQYLFCLVLTHWMHSQNILIKNLYKLWYFLSPIINVKLPLRFKIIDFRRDYILYINIQHWLPFLIFPDTHDVHTTTSCNNFSNTPANAQEPKIDDFLFNYNLLVPRWPCCK